jgi:hypothetical protein
MNAVAGETQQPVADRARHIQRSGFGGASGFAWRERPSRAAAHALPRRRSASAARDVVDLALLVLGAR